MIPTTPNRISKKIIRLYLSQGRELFPLARDVERGREVPIKQAGKKPLHKQWTERHYSEEELLAYVAEGHNLGFRLGERDLVVDVDPRNGGDESFARLREDLSLVDFEDIAPTVRTGGGGTHFYFRLPGKFSGRLHKNIAGYKGLDFCRFGGYVVIPGSYHYERESLYEIEFLSPYDLPAPVLPRELLDVLRVVESKPSRSSRGEDDAAEFTPEELSAILHQIPVEDYNSNEKWFELLLACHYATGGEGVDEFVAWSTDDPAYADDEDVIRARWDSVKNSGSRLVTSGTLVYHLHLYDGEVPGRESSGAADEFAEFLRLRPETPASETGTRSPSPKSQRGDSPPSPLTIAIESLSTESNARDINTVLRLAVPLSPIATDLVLRDIAKQTKASKTTLIKSLAELRKNKAEEDREDDPGASRDTADLADLSQQVAATVLRDKYASGRHLHYVDDGNYWKYDGRLWSIYFRGLTERDIYDAVISLRVDSPESDFNAASIMPQVERLLRAKTATDRQVYSQDLGAASVINLRDCELWINADGTLRKKKHRPESYLTTGIDVEFDKKAECPLFDKTLREIFAAESPSDREQIIRHLWEILGYLIQPKKNIASWFMFLGSGANGKSVVLSVLSALLGSKSVLEQSIGDFGPSGSRYARAALPGKLLVIDDDVSARTVLPDEFLKKISENKWIAAEVKYGGTVRFRSTASVLLASNDMPSVRDLSYGMLRRAMVIPFRRRFSREERDYNLADRIIETELPGVLLSALRGLRRLRKRGDFQIPRICDELRDQWRDRSNPLYGFLSDCIVRGEGDSALADSLWSTYELWNLENAIDKRFRMNRRNFWSQLETLGFRKYRGNGGKFRFKGVSIKSEED